MQQATLGAIGIILVLGGAGVGFWGVGWYHSGSECHPYYLAVETPESGYSDSPVVAYEELSADQQRVFRQTLTTTDKYMGVSQAFFDQPTRVRYRGKTYLATSIVSDGCSPILNFLLRVLPLGAGIGLILGGAYVISKSRHYQPDHD